MSERKESIVSAFDPFSSFTTDESTMDGGALFQNLENFRIAQVQWSQAMAELKTRVGDGKLYDYMSALGPKALTQVQDLLSLSDEQLKKYADMYHQMRVDAGTEAQAELTSELADTNKKLADAKKKAGDALDEYATKFKKTVKGFGGTIKSITPDIKKQSKALGDAFISSYTWSIKQGMPLVSSVYQTLTSIGRATAAGTKAASAVSNSTSNVFNITGVTDAIAVANAVSATLARQAARKKAAKGKK